MGSGICTSQAHTTRQRAPKVLNSSNSCLCGKPSRPAQQARNPKIKPAKLQLARLQCPVGQWGVQWLDNNQPAGWDVLISLSLSTNCGQKGSLSALYLGSSMATHKLGKLSAKSAMLFVCDIQVRKSGCPTAQLALLELTRSCGGTGEI